MTDTSDRYRRVAEGFTARVAGVPEGGWERPTPCEGWVARDVVRHVVETSGSFLGRAGLDLPPLPPVEDDPMGAWTGARDAVLAALEDADVASTELESPMGPITVEGMIGMFGIGDVLVHTWDLARATGQDETLDPDEVHVLFEAMAPRDEMMRGPAFGPKVEPPPDADEQTRLIAFSGRRP